MTLFWTDVVSRSLCTGYSNSLHDGGESRIAVLLIPTDRLSALEAND